MTKLLIVRITFDHTKTQINYENTSKHRLAQNRTGCDCWGLCIRFNHLRYN